MSTGCPQGSVLSPVLFTLFTNEFQLNDEQFTLHKYADDMALIGLLNPKEPSGEEAFLDHVQALQNWWNSSQLQIKELILTSNNFNITIGHITLKRGRL